MNGFLRDMSCISEVYSSAWYRLERLGRGSATAMHLKLQKLEWLEAMMWWIKGGKDSGIRPIFCLKKIVEWKNIGEGKWSKTHRSSTQILYKSKKCPSAALVDLGETVRLWCFFGRKSRHWCGRNTRKKHSACLVHSKSQNAPCSVLWDQHSLPT